MSNTTSAQNKLLMQQIFDGLARGDSSLFRERLADDAVWTVTAENSWSHTFRGREEILNDLFGYVRSLVTDRLKTKAFRFLADEDWVVIEARDDMMTKSGAPYCNHYCFLYRLENGRIVEMKEYQDSALCERALGRYPAERRNGAESNVVAASSKEPATEASN